MRASNAARAGESRADRRKRETRERLLGAALEVFRRRGFDAATTAEMAEAADVGAGTFYLYFRDKRDVYETLARHAAGEMIERWRTGLRPGLSLGDVAAFGLEKAAEFWLEDRERTQLLLEGGPTFPAEAHLHVVRNLADILRELPGTASRDFDAEVLATFLVGLAIELGRIVVASSSDAARRTIDGTIELARRAISLPRLSRGRR